MMNKDVIKIKECAKCGRNLAQRLIAIKQDSQYLCSQCYKRNNSKFQNPFANNVDEKEIKDLSELLKQNLGGRFFSESFKFPKAKKKFITPKEIVAYLDKNVKGQEEAKKILAVAVCNHYRRINAKADDVKIPKTNVLIQGPTGSGKTYILQMLAELLEVPFYIADASLITEASYKGNDVESVITGLYQAANGDIEKTQKGIIYLDEFDKLSAKFGGYHDHQSVGAGVQRQMLKMIEGCVMDIPKKGHRKAGECVTVNTENILFVCGGAFVGIREHDEEEKKMQSIGFCIEEKPDSSQKTPDKKLCPEDFINFGFIPEIVGRLPLIASLKELTEKDLVDILENTENSLIKKYRALFMDAYDVELVFEETAIREIAHQAYAKKIGARGLNAMIENVMQDLLYEIPSDPSICKCIITKEVVEGLEKPRVIKEQWNKKCS